jgi:hypothetical protein
MKKITLLLAAVVGAITVSTAQIRIAPEVGATLNKMKMDPDPGTSFKVGGRVGGIVDIPLSKNLYLQPGIAFAMKGSKSDLLSLEITTNLNYIEVPVNLVYKFGQEGSGRLFVGLGPNLAYAVSGTQKTSGSIFGISFDGKEDITFGSDSSEVKAFDFGGNLSVGYELPMGLYARAYYQMGFAKLTNNGSDTKNMGFGLSIGYFFGNKSKKPSAASAE